MNKQTILLIRDLNDILVYMAIGFFIVNIFSQQMKIVIYAIIVYCITGAITEGLNYFDYVLEREERKSKNVEKSKK